MIGCLRIIKKNCEEVVLGVLLFTLYYVVLGVRRVKSLFG